MKDQPLLVRNEAIQEQSAKGDLCIRSNVKRLCLNLRITISKTDTIFVLPDLAYLDVEHASAHPGND